MTEPKDKFDWMYRRQIANLPMTPSYVRNDFTKWWNLLCKEIDSDLKKKVEEIYKACNEERVWEIQNRLGELLKTFKEAK